MPRLTFDLGEIFKDTIDAIKLNYLFLTTPKEAPPSIRNADVAFISLKNAQNTHCGVFVPELYELAKVNGLMAQQQEAKWLKDHTVKSRAQIRLMKEQPFYDVLYKADGVRKSAFELGVLAIPYSDNDKKSYRGIQKRVEDEFNNRIEQGQALPAVVDKYQIGSDYLRKINVIGLHATDPRGIKLNLLNPADKTPVVERAAHYFAQRMAFVATMLAAITVVAGTPSLFMASALGVVLAKWCGEEFGMFGLAESLLREIRSNFSKDFRFGEVISLKKTIKTGLLFAAVGVAAVGVLSATWTGILGLSMWTAASSTLGLTAAAGLQYGLAGFLAGIAGVSTLIGGVQAQRFFWGFGIWDKQIDFTKEKALDAVNQDPAYVQKLAKWQHKLDKLQDLPKEVRNDRSYRTAVDALDNLAVLAFAKHSNDHLKSQQKTANKPEQQPAPKKRRAIV